MLDLIDAFYSIFNKWLSEDNLKEVIQRKGVSFIAKVRIVKILTDAKIVWIGRLDTIIRFKLECR